MTTFVLVHGGRHGGWCWQRITPILRAASYHVYTPTLTLDTGHDAMLTAPDALAEELLRLA